MAKFAADTLMDQALNYVKNNGTLLVICAGQPADAADATTDTNASPAGNALGETTIASGDYTGPAAGDASGRKITVNQQTGVTIDVTGTADHVAVVDNSSPAELLLVTTVTSQSVTSGNTATINAFDYEIVDVS